MPAHAGKASLSSARLSKPQGAPRGLLIHYILHKIASKPSHGYEILQDIEDRTKGAWRPGPGSTYPILKKLLKEGMIKVDSSAREDTRRVYHITPKGLGELRAAKQTLANYGERWQALRGLIAELIDADHMEKFIVEGSKGHFQFTQDIFNKNMKNIPSPELEYILKEYTLNLERQLGWARQVLDGMKIRARGVAK
ncbi:MAG TPA: PadR family transcriptional regulator [Nitrososphaera sp.]|jgi:DNA-binding PadR family transcriptional regulator|nr:PadR family transcriptional regulator [Nitrososphaera sp.]